MPRREMTIMPQDASKPWPAEKVERWNLKKLRGYDRNARVHSASQISQIEASIREWGWTIPILIDDTGMILAGHARADVARRMKIAEVPVIVARGWTAAQKRAYVIADNKIASNSSYDNDLLLQELGDISQDGLVELTGFSSEEIGELLHGVRPDANETEEEEKGKELAIRVFCRMDDLRPLADAIRQMVDHLGLEGVTIRTPS